MVNQTQIPSARVPLTEGENNLMSREWFRYFNNLNTLAGGGAGLIPASSGGTGVSTIPANGQLLIGNGTGYTLNTLSAGTNIAVANGAGNISVSFSGVLSPSQGGTGTSTIPPLGSILIGGGTNYTVGTVAAGSNVSITNDGTTITISASGAPSTTPVTLTYAATVTPASGSRLTYRMTMTGNLVINAPSGAADGDQVELWLTASGGSWTVAFAFAVIPTSSTLTSPVTIASGTQGELMFRYDSVLGAWKAARFVNGY